MVGTQKKNKRLWPRGVRDLPEGPVVGADPVQSGDANAPKCADINRFLIVFVIENQGRQVREIWPLKPCPAGAGWEVKWATKPEQKIDRKRARKQLKHGCGKHVEKGKSHKQRGKKHSEHFSHPLSKYIYIYIYIYISQCPIQVDASHLPRTK